MEQKRGTDILSGMEAPVRVPGTLVMYKTNGLKGLVIATVMLTTAIPAAVQATQKGNIEIKSVDSYEGGSRVTTDKFNTTIRVVELDKNSNPVRSWTGKTDSDGKLTLPRAHGLTRSHLQAETSLATGTEFITPTAVESTMPFTFAATGVVE